MTAHTILPGVVLGAGFSHPAYERYLRAWREQAIVDADDGRAAASVCHQATLIDLVLDGRPMTGSRSWRTFLPMRSADP